MTSNSKIGNANGGESNNKNNHDAAANDANGRNNDTDVVEDTLTALTSKGTDLFWSNYNKYVRRTTDDNRTIRFEELKIPLLVLFVAIVATGNVQLVIWRVLYPIYWLILRTIAVAIGVALGLGLSTHVYDQLEYWAGQNRKKGRQQASSSLLSTKSSAVLGGGGGGVGGSTISKRKEETQALLMEQMRTSAGVGGNGNSKNTKTEPSTGQRHYHKGLDLSNDSSNSYASLMASAGYDVDPNWKRGQVVREILPTAYPFTDTINVESQYSVQVMRLEWPSLPPQIVRELGRFLEYVMRDYVSTWYSLIDVGIPYPDECLAPEDREDPQKKEERKRKESLPYPFPRRMVFSTASTRALPLLENIYRSASVLIGNLAYRVQDVNVFRLVLLKWTKIIAHTFKVYRHLRKQILDKQEAHKQQQLLQQQQQDGAGATDAVVGNVGRVVRGVINSVKSADASSIAQQVLAQPAPATTENTSTTTMMDASERDANNGRRRSSVTLSMTSNSSTVAGAAQDSTTTTIISQGEGIPNNPAYQQVSEMALTREFLVTGKLHPACTFGLEVPSLLFADPTGEDCGTGAAGEGEETNESNTASADSADDDDNGNSVEDNSPMKSEDQVLEERLFHSRLIAECELDYNRVLASRIIKLLTPRQDYGSPIAASLLTEILGGCVLAPVMECFSPDYLNDWIIQGIELATGTGEEEKEESGATPSNAGTAASTTPIGADGQPIMRTWDDYADDDDNGVGNDNNNLQSFSEEDGEMVLEEAFDQEGQQELRDLMNLSSNEIDYSELNKEAAEDLLGTGSEEDDNLLGAKPESAGNTDDDEDETEEDDEMEEDDIILEETTNAAGVFHMISLLAEALMNLQRQLDLEDCRRNSQGGSGVEVDWDNPNCKRAVLRLVLVVEALLLHGRRQTPIPIALSSSGNEDNVDGEGNQPEDETVQEEFNSGSLTQILMDLTSDIEAFEKMHVKPQDNMDDGGDEDVSEEDGDGVDARDYEPTASDLSTLRTLIAAWLHTGNIYKTVSTLIKAKTTVLRPFYHSRAFLRNQQTSAALLRQLRTLDGVDIMVDTVAILNSARIDPELEVQASSGADTGGSSDDNVEAAPPAESLPAAKSESQASEKKKFGIKGLLDKGMQNLNDKKKAIGEKVNKDILKGSLKGRNPLNRAGSSDNQSQSTRSAAVTHPRINRELSTSSTQTAPVSTNFSQIQSPMPMGTPRYLDFHRNEAFASSLRSERERRMQSWITSIQKDTEMIQVVTRIKGTTAEDTAFHRELHHVARIFYAGTNLIGIRDAARSGTPRNRDRLNTADSSQSLTSAGSDQAPEVSLLTVEMACARRRIEVPDDDSSFLLRAQPRALSSMGVHRDTRNADQSYKGFAASFEEPAVAGGTTRKGRYVRRCQLRYYPSDRTASVVLLNDVRKLDQRKGKSNAPDRHHGRQVSVNSGSVPFLAPDFMRERHLCQKWIPKGSTSRSQPGIMSSNVMEQADFTAAPRTGKALDFVYRMSLFESPMIDLGGKRFTVHDSAAQGGHRADASALEMSDAALSAALLVCGRDYSMGGMQQPDDASVGNVRNKVELGPDGYPIIWMKYSRKLADGTASTEIKPYRVSFIRAAMLITSTRQEAQLQCLVKCVKAGSAKSATKARTDAQLRPTLRLLDFARDRSREKQEKLQRDLKLGINHIDREQLRRNALLSPRYPTKILNIQVSIEKALPAKDAIVRIPGNPQSTVFKIRCVATVALVSEDVPKENLEPYRTPDGKLALTYKESWAVFRPFRDFQTLHKHLKAQVAVTESSGTAGSRLVGAAAAAFTAGNTNQLNRNRQRNALIPSLGQANKAGALGVTQRSITKRMEILDGYLHQILSQGHLLSCSPEVLMFIGAFFPLSSDVRVGKMPISSLNDPLGRAEQAREALKFASTTPTRNPSLKNSFAEGTAGTENNLELSQSRSELHVDTQEDEYEDQKSEKILMTNTAIVNKIDKVPLGQVRNRLFELLTHQFGFENASFFRGQMLSAIKTMSFAVTTPGEFRKTLYKTHLEQCSADALAYWIGYGIETLWPDGVFFESSPELTPEQQKKLADKSREMLHSTFPEQLRTVLGGNLTRDGLDMLHEMLQNRMVVKSMFYMLFDLVWEEIFPEMKDILSCGKALDINLEEED